MKALSIKQPFASLITLGIKPIENRTWRTNFRGRIYVHASMNLPKDHWGLLSPEQYKQAMDSFIDGKLREELHLGAIIGEVDIVDCVINHPSIWAEKSEGTFIGKTFYHKEGTKPIWNWVLANPVMYDEPILNVKGKLSLWDFNQ
ncbi:ASCH domain-containing protein [Elizabethkingia meningoseptica]|uniref:ASCH domain-containing protein n=1 Tax=Elizabethkingia meningoseptica TaxID=238 RepID=UPI0016266B11|nr:ASCH domain-containing protein [Elizabethkingia meningoseptica]MBG0512912.1 ASCH domain-containing protein [Elizabethkingia meningoseptica]MBG0515179.1 ASCH domain-containing protein [Elizabethkingia meningoseptica]